MGREQVDIFHLHNAITANGGGESLSAQGGARRSGSGIREVAPAGQNALPRHHRRRRHGGAAPGDRLPNVRLRAGQLQHAEPQRGIGTAGQLSGAGLRQDVRPHPGCRCRRRRHPRAGRRRAERRSRAASDRQPAARSDRFGQQPTTPTCSVPAGCCRWCRRAMPAALPEAAMRFAITHQAMGTILVGMATSRSSSSRSPQSTRGRCRRPRSPRLGELQQGFVGEQR